MAASSSPPTSASSSTGSVTWAARRRAASTSATLTGRRSSGRPAPGPTTFVAATPQMAAMRHADGVVLPIPMSPATRRSAPPSTHRWAASRPTASAARASSTVMAGPRAMLAVPGRTLVCSMPAAPSRSPATPTSTTQKVAPTTSANVHTAAAPAAIVATMAVVTSEGQALAPSATTPWSPAKTTTAGAIGTGGGDWAVMPARWTARASRRPRAPGGLARVSQRARAAAMAAASSGGSATSVLTSRS